MKTNHAQPRAAKTMAKRFMALAVFLCAAISTHARWADAISSAQTLAEYHHAQLIVHDGDGEVIFRTTPPAEG